MSEVSYRKFYCFMDELGLLKYFNNTPDRGEELDIFHRNIHSLGEYYFFLNNLNTPVFSFHEPHGKVTGSFLNKTVWLSDNVEWFGNKTVGPLVQPYFFANNVSQIVIEVENRYNHLDDVERFVEYLLKLSVLVKSYLTNSLNVDTVYNFYCHDVSAERLGKILETKLYEPETGVFKITPEECVQAGDSPLVWVEKLFQ